MTTYVYGNPPTKKNLVDQIKRGERPEVFSPGPFPSVQNGDTTVSGPQYPEPHGWYARVRVEDGRITKILS